MAENDVCPRCGARFECAMKTGKERCWCTDMPPLRLQPQPSGTNSCYCPACLGELLKEAGQLPK